MGGQHNNKKNQVMDFGTMLWHPIYVLRYWVCQTSYATNVG